MHNRPRHNAFNLLSYNYMKEKLFEYKTLIINRRYFISFVNAILFFSASVILNYYAGTYATENASNSVTDVILSNTRAYDLDGIFVWGSIVLFFAIVYVCLSKPGQIPFILKSLALFITTRSLFISLTHIGPFPSSVHLTSNLLNDLTFGGDLFFSGHTGMPFLLALIFWNEKWKRYMFLAFSLTFAVVVLLAHMHYTIDVLSAFFITFTIFHIADYAYKKDKKFYELK